MIKVLRKGSEAPDIIFHIYTTCPYCKFKLAIKEEDLTQHWNSVDQTYTSLFYYDCPVCNKRVDVSYENKE